MQIQLGIIVTSSGLCIWEAPPSAKKGNLKILSDLTENKRNTYKTGFELVGENTCFVQSYSYFSEQMT